MQPSVDSYSVQRRQMDVEDYVDILRRHRSWIAGPAFAGLVIAVVVAFFWPDTYVSDATIRIVPSTVPERYVASNVNFQVGQRIASMYQQVTTRTNLLAWINSLALYPRKKGRVADDDLVEAMFGVVRHLRSKRETRRLAARPRGTHRRPTRRRKQRRMTP